MTGTRSPGFTSGAVVVLAAAVLHGWRGPFAGAGRPAVVQQAPPTFTRDVAPIIFTACAPCHRPEGGAPFSLLTYDDVRSRAAAIVTATARRAMPPWKPEPGYGEFADERRLTERQIATLRAWAEGGAIEGDPAALPPAPTWTGQWALGEPDLVLRTPVYTLRAGSGDVYRNFVLPIETTQTRYVRAWQFLPGDAAVVHHATMQFDFTGASRQLDAQDPEPGYEGLIPHSVGSPEGFFLGWLPGHTPYVAPDGMAWPLPAPSDLVMMLHLKPSGTEEQVQARLGLYFSDVPPRLHPVLIRLTRQDMDIPAGQQRYVVTDSFKLDADVDVYTVQPHAHYLAREIKAFATLPGGGRKWLIYIADWSFDWQGVFRYRRPERLPAGTTIEMEYVYDNSAINPHNPHHPPTRVTFGQRTTEEMAELWLQVVPRRAADGPPLVHAMHEKMVRAEISGLEKRLEIDPVNAPLHDDVAVLYAEIGRLDRAAAHFAETARLSPDSAAAHYNLGNALFQQGRRVEAAAQLRESVALRPGYALAHDGLGVALYAEGRTNEAIGEYERASELDPRSADAHHHLAIALRRAGRLADAIAHYRQVLAIEPTRASAKAELAEVERQLGASGARQ